MNDEKSQIISDMILMSQADGIVQDSEYQFILLIARQLGISKEEVNSLKSNPKIKTTFSSEYERLTQFYRVFLLMNIDKETHFTEIDTLRNYGLRLGLRLEAIEHLLTVMQEYEHKLIPSERLLKIFKRFYN